MKRLYFITHSLNSAESISHDIHQLGISNYNFHVMSRNAAGLYKRHIHSSNIYHDNNIVQQAERGGLLGAVLGVLVLFVASFMFKADISLLATLGMIGFLMFIGSWIGGFIGIHQENYKVEKFHDCLEQGKYLVMIDVKPDEIHLVEDIIITRHKKTEHGGVGSTVILPF